MGTYINPPTIEHLKTIGREIEGITYTTLVEQLSDGEVLVGLFARNDAPFNNAPHLFSEAEFAVFDNQRKHGVLRLLGFFAVPDTCLPSSNW